MVTVKLKAHKEENVYRFHPWIFSGAIQQMDGEPAEGDVVRVVDSKGTFLALGHYQLGSIMIRILSFEDQVLDRAFYKRRLESAYNLRQTLHLTSRPDHNTYRLVYGEGDNLPGLIIDVYGTTAVMQAHTIGMHYLRMMLAELVVELVDAVENVFYKSGTTLPESGPESPIEGYLIGKETNGMALENGLKFQVDWLKGQKTGFFVDQRENRQLLEYYAQGKSVLNMFCYTGGFSFYALRGGATRVDSVDSSSKAIQLTDQNVALNFGDDSRHHSFAEDAFKYLDGVEGQYDVIVLDPPAFAKHRKDLRHALKGYQRLNAKAFKGIKPGGILFTFSCSQTVSKEQFRLAVFSAAAESKRSVRILHQLSQPADHPINIYHPEGEYLKGLVVYVE